jgi:hypothetical protein
MQMLFKLDLLLYCKYIVKCMYNWLLKYVNFYTFVEQA